MKKIKLLPFLLSICISPLYGQDSEKDKYTTVQQGLNSKESAIWSIRNIPVCWDNASDIPLVVQMIRTEGWKNNRVCVRPSAELI